MRSTLWANLASSKDMAGRRVRRLRKRAMLLLAAASLGAGPAAYGQTVTPPSSFFGFELGSDGNYASWDQEIAYYKKLAAESDRVQTRVIGTSTRGQPFLVVTISSPANLAKSARYQEIARKLADPRGLTDAQIKALVTEGKVVVLDTLGQHSNEIASSQVGPLLAYQLATSNDTQTKAILDNAILVLIPSFNPDGLVTVKDWTAKTAGTPYQGSQTPDLWHYYTGHDNNRDAYMLNLAESKLWAQVAYHEWFPQIYQDTHQQGPFASRLFLPPKTDPILPDVDPIVWRETMMLGAAMATQLEAAGIKGVETQAGSYTGWQMPTFHGMTPARNIVGFHTESASSKMIWPLFVKPEQLQVADRGRPENTPQMSFPSPWAGGWWHMGDIVKQQKIALLATLETAARQREMFLGNMALMARRQIERGATEAPYAHVISQRQQDPGTTDKLIATLMEASVEVSRATTGFQAGGVTVEPGDFVIRSDQPLRGYIHSLLVPYSYPDNATTRRADGTPLVPKDFASTNLGELMGVKVAPVIEPLTDAEKTGLQLLTAPPKPTGQITGSGAAGWLLTPTWNDSFRAVTQILQSGGTVSRLTAATGTWAPGTFWIPAGGATTVKTIAALSSELGLPFEAVASVPVTASFALKPLRVGLYRRYGGGNPDEGWTRYILDTWKLPYSRIDASDVKAGNLGAKYDVIVVPDDSVGALFGKPRGSREEGPATPTMPEFDRNLDDAAVAELKSFAQAGGTMVFLDGASELAIQKFGIPVTDAVAGLKSREYYSPGSMLHVTFDTSKPLAYGMPSEGLVLADSSPVFEVGAGTGSVAVAGRFPSAKVLQSGWLIGEPHIAGKAALVDVTYGKGRLVLIGFGAQRRAETHGTYKVLFNAMYLNGAPQ
ncbi:M14 family metallopeptidase [soil metagenome]